MKRAVYIVIGSICVLLGVIGIFIPLLPTTPFLLLAAALYFRSSENLYNRLLSNKYLGPYIKSFREDKSIPLRAKIISVTLLWITGVHCIMYLLPNWWTKIIMGIIVITVTVYILSLKTRKRDFKKTN